MRLLAFAFCELAEGSAALASLGEARSDRCRRVYLDAVRAAVQATGGRSLTPLGDSALTAFESATAALEFADSLERSCAREGRRWNERLDLRVGIDLGEVASDEPADAATSQAAQRAQALARAASGGGVLATSVAAAVAIGTEARFRPAGLVDLPGLTDRMAAVEVSWERPPSTQAPLPPELEGRGARPPFVGRTSERERLEAAWRLATEGERHLAFVLGEPGIGKTRLVAEFARSVHAEGATVLWGRSFEEMLTPYQPFVQALQHHVRWTPAEELADQLGPGAAVLSRLVPELGSRIARPESPQQDPESERYRLFEAAARLLQVASAERPVLLVLDDLQWADHGTLLLLKHLVTDAAPASILLLGTYRHSEVGREHPLAQLMVDVERERVVERIELGGLAEAEVAKLVGSLLGWAPPLEVVRSLHGETEGNPFFLEEVVRHLEQLGLGTDRGRLAQVEATVQELGVPSRVRELVSRRVQRLSPEAQAALSSAAVVGGEFARDILARMLGLSDPAALVGALDEAVAARLVVEAPDRLGRYRFSHALIQQALYEEQTRNRRAALHERAAEAMEALHAAGLASHAELAYHYARAGESHAAKVVHHGREAGEASLGLFAYEDAVRSFTAALAALRSLGDDPRQRARLLALLGTAHTRAGDYAAARAAFHEAAELSAVAGAWPLLAEAVLGYGGGSGFGGVWTTFAAVDEELVRLLELALDACPPGDCHERVRLLGRLAQALYWSSQTERTMALSEEALAIARRLDDPAALAYALDSRHVVLWSPDHLSECRAIAEEMLELGRGLGDRDIQLEALAWLITDALERDPIAVVDRYIAEHARIAAELRQPYHLWYTEATRAMRAHLDGRFHEAAELVESAYAYGRDSHGENARQTYLVQTMFLKVDTGELDDLIEGLKAYAKASPLLAWRTALAVGLGVLERREEALEQVGWFAEHGFDSIRRDCIWMTSLVDLARTAAHFDDVASSERLYALLLPFADRNCVVGGAVLCLGPVSRILGMLARATGRPDAALEHFAHALERARALGAPPIIARTQVEAARAHLERGKGDDAVIAGRLLDAAEETATRIGMTKLLDEVAAVRQRLPEPATA